MLERLMDAVGLSADRHELREPASAADVAASEAELGRSLPEEARAVYRWCDGGSFVDTNLRVNPLRADPLGLVGASDWLRSVDWTIPDELVVFGDNGSDDSFGLWLPRGRDSGDPAPVIQIAEVGDGFAVAGTALVPFLTARIAYYLVGEDESAGALAALDVPEALREAESDDALFVELTRWADPGLEDPDPDPYARPVDVDALRRRFGSDR